MLFSLEELIADSDAIVIGVLKDPASDDESVPGAVLWRGTIDVEEVLLGEIAPGQAIRLGWVNFVVTDDFSRHYERLVGEKRIWLLVEGEGEDRYAAANSGRCLELEERARVEAILQDRAAATQGGSGPGASCDGGTV
jgi:hypothetical protein